jgi:hypothetical protein
LGSAGGNETKSADGLGGGHLVGAIPAATPNTDGHIKGIWSQGAPLPLDLTRAATPAVAAKPFASLDVLVKMVKSMGVPPAQAKCRLGCFTLETHPTKSDNFYTPLCKKGGRCVCSNRFDAFKAEYDG